MANEQYRLTDILPRLLDYLRTVTAKAQTAHRLTGHQQTNPVDGTIYSSGDYTVYSRKNYFDSAADVLTIHTPVFTYDVYLYYSTNTAIITRQ